MVSCVFSDSGCIPARKRLVLCCRFSAEPNSPVTDRRSKSDGQSVYPNLGVDELCPSQTDIFETCALTVSHIGHGYPSHQGIGLECDVQNSEKERTMNTDETQKPWEGMPSVESMTIAFVEWARAQDEASITEDLSCNEFDFSLTLEKNFEHPELGRLAEVLIVNGVEVPAKYSGSGWFKLYSKLCESLAADGLLLRVQQDLRLDRALELLPYLKTL